MSQRGQAYRYRSIDNNDLKKAFLRGPQFSGVRVYELQLTTAHFSDFIQFSDVLQDEDFYEFISDLVILS